MKESMSGSMPDGGVGFGKYMVRIVLWCIFLKMGESRPTIEEESVLHCMNVVCV